MQEHGAHSAPSTVYQFPGASCISVNDEAVHGIPAERNLQEGDLVKLDVTVEKDGYMADAAITVPVGRVSLQAEQLMACPERAFHQARLVARPGFRVFAIPKIRAPAARNSVFS